MKDRTFEDLEREDPDNLTDTETICPECGELMYAFFDNNWSVDNYVVWLICKSCKHIEKE